MSRTRASRPKVVFIVVLVLVASACSGDGSVQSSSGSVTTTTASVTATSGPARAGFSPQPGPGTPVVVDYNPTTSDVAALLFLLQHGEVRVDAITIPGTGESHCNAAVTNTLGLLALVGKDGIPVACGSSDPIAGENQWPDEWRSAADELAGLTLPPGGEPSAFGGAELLVAAVMQSPEPVKLLTLGPLTNVGEALALEPSLVDNLDAIHIMGGAVDVGGNVFVNDVAEWNVWIDPAAAKAVFDSGAPIVLIPLDATNDVPVTRGWHDRLAANRTTPAASAIHDLFAASPGVLDGGFYFWDELAAAVLTDHSYVTLEAMTLSVVQQGVEAGWTKPDPGGAHVEVAVAASGLRFESDLLNILNGQAPVEVTEVDPELRAYFLALETVAETFDARLTEWFEDNEGTLLAVFEPETRPLDEARAASQEFVSEVMAIFREDAEGTQALDVPEGARTAHQTYVEASTALLSLEPLLLQQIRSATFEELARLVEVDLGSAVRALGEACEELQSLARAGGIDVDLYCSGQ